MKISKGVELFLAKGATIRPWIRMQERNVSVHTKKVNNAKIRVLRICQGEACFLPGGSVGLRMQGFLHHYVAFPPKRVLEIRDLEGKVLVRNYFACPKCCMLTGVQSANTTPPPEGYPTYSRTFHFTCKDCGEQWEHVR